MCVVEDLEGISIELAGSDGEENVDSVPDLQEDIADDFNLISQESQSLAMSMKTKTIPYQESVKINENTVIETDFIDMRAAGDIRENVEVTHNNKESTRGLEKCSISEKEACDQTVCATDMLVSNEGEVSVSNSIVSGRKNLDVSIPVTGMLDTSQAWNVDLAEGSPQQLKRKPGIPV